MQAVADNDNPVEPTEQPMLEAQSSFVGDEMAAALRPAAAAKPDTDDLMQDEESQERERDVFEVMFDCQIKNLVEFVDKKQVSQQKTKEETQHDIILYIQDEFDFYQAWENVFRSEVPDFQNEEDGERYKASQTTWIHEMPEVLTFQMQRT